MSFNWQGLILVLLTILFVGCQFVAHRWIKKVTNSYFFWLAIGILCFTWLMVFRYAKQFSEFWSRVVTTGFDDPGSEGQSIIISGGFLLDICPMMGFILPISLMVDPSRKIAKVIAPTSILAGAITIGSLIGDHDAALTAHYIFIAVTPAGGNPCYFIMHFLQITLGIGVMLNTPRYGWKGWVFGISFTLLLYTYIGIVKSATGARWYVSGLDYNDWETGEYRFVAEILHFPPRICPYICLPFMWCVGCSEVAIKDYVFDRGWFKYGNAYSGKWYNYYNYNKYVPQKIM